ncbi:MAG: hypothetical protein HY931_03265 [Candidatus Falkowbacteria bacterium]|nr:MAG: hypothetical protein HY931_03265 [Candidatus Falkowbacteria bacterium]
MADYQLAIGQKNREEAVKKVFAKYEEFLLSLSIMEAINLGAEMGFWSKTIATKFN